MPSQFDSSPDFSPTHCRVGSWTLTGLWGIFELQKDSNYVIQNITQAEGVPTYCGVGPRQQIPGPLDSLDRCTGVSTLTDCLISFTHYWTELWILTHISLDHILRLQYIYLLIWRLFASPPGFFPTICRVGSWQLTGLWGKSEQQWDSHFFFQDITCIERAPTHCGVGPRQQIPGPLDSLARYIGVSTHTDCLTAIPHYWQWFWSFTISAYILFGLQYSSFSFWWVFASLPGLFPTTCRVGPWQLTGLWGKSVSLCCNLFHQDISQLVRIPTHCGVGPRQLFPGPLDSPDKYTGVGALTDCPCPSNYIRTKFWTFTTISVCICFGLQNHFPLLGWTTLLLANGALERIQLCIQQISLFIFFSALTISFWRTPVLATSTTTSSSRRRGKSGPKSRHSAISGRGRSFVLWLEIFLIMTWWNSRTVGCDSAM